MKTNLIRIALAATAVTALGLSACSAGAETKPAGNTQAVTTTQAASNPPAGATATASNGGDVNVTASASGSDDKSSAENKNDGGKI